MNHGGGGALTYKADTLLTEIPRWVYGEFDRAIFVKNTGTVIQKGH